ALAVSAFLGVVLVACNRDRPLDPGPPAVYGSTPAPATNVTAAGAGPAPVPAAPPPKKTHGSFFRDASARVRGVCAGGACAAPSPTDGVKNGDETDVDCGGSKAPACVAGRYCFTTSDCESHVCGGDDHVCLVAPSCTGRLGAGSHCGPTLDESC